MWSNETLKTIDDIARNISKVEGVAKVRTATRPLGEQITETTLPGQIKKLSGGLGQVEGGFEPIISGLDKMEKGIRDIASGVSDGSGQLGKLLDATNQTNEGITKINDGLAKLGKGTGASSEGLVRINEGLKKLSGGVVDSRDGISKVYSALEAAQKSLEAVVAAEPALTRNADFQKAYGTVKAVLVNINNINAGLDVINNGIASATASINSVNIGITGIADGIGKSNEALVKIQSALNMMKEGQSKAIDGLNLASTNLTKIAAGFEPSKEGLNKIKSGLSEVQGATSGYTDKSKAFEGVFFLPDGALEKYPELKEAMEFYIAPNSKAVTFEVILSAAPYSREALDSISKINDAVKFTVKDTVLEDSVFHIGGATSAISEMRDITAGDFVKVMFFVLLGIFLVLALMLRSIIAPFYLMLTIILSFATTMGISYLTFQVLLGHEGLTWSVPFFSFCLLVALGVDYNIFLMSRVKEEYVPGDVKGGVARALSSTGGIITSCGIIMAGTFGAFIASPVTQLVEIGFATVVGLLLDTFVIRCLLVPALAVKVGELNWWPGRKVKVISAQPEK
jgi:putative drug exporter of the RND superfamily